MSNLRYTLLIYDEDDTSVRHFFENNCDARFERIREVSHFKDFGMLRDFVSQTDSVANSFSLNLDMTDEKLPVGSLFIPITPIPFLGHRSPSVVPTIDLEEEQEREVVSFGTKELDKEKKPQLIEDGTSDVFNGPPEKVYTSDEINGNFKTLYKCRKESGTLSEKLVIKLSNDFEEVVHRPSSEVPTTSLEDEEEQEKIRLFKLKILAKEVNFQSPKVTSVTLDKDTKKEDPQSSNKVPKKIQDKSYDQRRREVMKMIAEKCRNPDIQLPTENGKSTISAGIKENGELEELKRRIAFIEKEMVTAKMVLKGRQSIDPVPEEQEEAQLIEYVQENVVEERDNFAEPCHDDFADDDEFQPDLQITPETSELREVENEELVEMGEQETQKTKLKRGDESRREYNLRKTNEAKIYVEEDYDDDEEDDDEEENDQTEEGKAKFERIKERKIINGKRHREKQKEKMRLNLLPAVANEEIERRREAKRIRKNEYSREYWRKLKNDQTEEGKAKYEIRRERHKTCNRRHYKKQKEKIKLNLLTEKEKERIERKKTSNLIRNRNMRNRKREMRLVVEEQVGGMVENRANA